MQPSFSNHQGNSLIDWILKDLLHAGLYQVLLALSLQGGKGLWGGVGRGPVNCLRQVRSGGMFDKRCVT